MQWSRRCRGRRTERSDETGQCQRIKTEPSGGTPPDHRRIDRTYDRILLGPGEGLDGHVFGLDMTRRVSGADTDGAFFAVEFELSPGEEVPPHLHHDEEEVLYVVEGEIESRVGEKTHDAPAGSCHTIPRGTVHGQANHGTDPATLLVMFSPPHLEELFERSTDVTPDEFEKLAADYGMEPAE